MKVLKQRFTQWFNGKHARRGTLWEDRFRSVLVEGRGHALKAMAAYIDLNPVRAGICDDPKDYRWCGYGEAVGAVSAKKARQAIQYLASFDLIEKAEDRKEAETLLRSFKASQERWRRFLFGLPESKAMARKVLAEVEKAETLAQKEGYEKVKHQVTTRDRISREKALEVLQEGGKLGLADYARCKIRYFSDGAAIGARSFIEDIFQENREKFGEKRKEGAKPIRGLSFQDKDTRLYNLRQLQKQVWS